MLNIIHNEDCFKTYKNIEDSSIDCVFTSPPYNRKRNDKYKHYFDDIPDYYEMLNLLIQESLRVSKKYVFINIMKNYYNSQDVYRIIGNYYDKILEMFVWEKSNPLPARGLAITNAYEFIICLGKIQLKSNKTYTKNHLTTSVTRMPKEHKAVMHLDVARFFISNFTNENDIIYDPFMGTGTTALACIESNRNWLGSEISVEYFNMANKRIEDSKKSNPKF